jgi:hypothetical protein
VTNTGRHFINEVVSNLLSHLSIKYRRASPYYPQTNGLVKKTNGILCGILAKMILHKRQEWDLHINSALWAYRSSYKVTTNASPFLLTYDHNAVLSPELEVLSLRISLAHEASIEESMQFRWFSLKSLHEKREDAIERNIKIQLQRKNRQDDCPGITKFQVGDLVMLVDSWLIIQIGFKFHPKWKGPFEVQSAYDNGALIDRHVNGTQLK